MKYRIITDGHHFKVQYGSWWHPLWFTVQRPEDFNNKIIEGDRFFNSKEEAQGYIDKEKSKNKWNVVK